MPHLLLESSLQAPRRLGAPRRSGAIHLPAEVLPDAALCEAVRPGRQDFPQGVDVSVVIPAYNRADLLARCLASLRQAAEVTCEITVVDNCSPQDLSAVRDEFPEVRWIRLNRNIGYAGANNLALEGAQGRHLCWINADAEVLPGTLAALARYLDDHPHAGAVTPCNVGTDGLPQWTLSPDHGLAMAWLRDSALHLLFPRLPLFANWSLPHFDFQSEQEIATTQTTCLLIRSEAYERVGGMDPTLFLFYNDVDFCRRLRAAGWRLVYLPEPPVLHHGSASVQTAPWVERQLWRDRYRYFRKHFGAWGALGVQLACISRGFARVASHLVTGRWRSVPAVARLSTALFSGLKSSHNGD